MFSVRWCAGHDAHRRRHHHCLAIIFGGPPQWATSGPLPPNRTIDELPDRSLERLAIGCW